VSRDGNGARRLDAAHTQTIISIIGDTDNIS
jgi:hypothetical protein